MTNPRIRSLPLLLSACLSSTGSHSLTLSPIFSRRALFTNGIVAIASTTSSLLPALAAANTTFETNAYNKQEYTNAIVASRDTNISPKEVYDTLLQLKSTKATTNLRALDVGAGAGVSTQVLWDMGYTTIDAVDWSGDAWEQNVVSCPDSVTFYALDDERFLKTVWSKATQYDVIAFNFAVNRQKAEYFASTLLKEDGILLAPINTQTDYWLKQVYTLMDHSGKTLWTANDVGAWSVQFQPDVTQDTCQGVWCSPYNGFKRLK
jgi:protein-L-isoaspartate O-methyltransferase